MRCYAARSAGSAARRDQPRFEGLFGLLFIGAAMRLTRSAAPASHSAQRATRLTVWRLSKPAISLVAASSQSISTPVLLTYAFQHAHDALVCDVAGGAGAYGQSFTEAAGSGIDDANALLPCRHRFWQAPGRRYRASASQGWRLEARHRLPSYRLGLERRADADGVAERDRVSAADPTGSPAARSATCLGLDLAIETAAEHAGDIAAHLDAIGLGTRQHRPEAFDRLRDRAVDIGA